MKNVIIELLRWVYWYPLRIIIQRMPIAVSYKIAEIVLPIYSLLVKRNRLAIQNGLRIMYEGKRAEKDIHGMVFETLDNILKTSIDKFYYPKFDKKYCDKNIEYSGLEYLDQALKAGRGVVLLHGHLGNPHIIMPAIGCRGYTLHQLASRNPPENVCGVFSRFINSMRYAIYELDTANKEKLPVHFIYVDVFLRAPFEALRRNEVIAIGMDGREGVKSVEIDFLHHKAIFYTGAMRLIMRAKPVVLPTFHIRNKNNTHTIIIEKPMNIEVSGYMEQDILHNIKKFAGILEKYVYQYPGQYAGAFCLKDPFLRAR